MQATSITLKIPKSSDIAVNEDVVFTPEQVSPELTTFVHRPADGLVIGTSRVSVRYTPATKQRPYAKSTLAFSMPKVGTLGLNVPGVVGTSRIAVDVQISEHTTDVERAQLAAYLTQLAESITIHKALFLLDPLY